MMKFIPWAVANYNISVALLIAALYRLMLKEHYEKNYYYSFGLIGSFFSFFLSQISDEHCMHNVMSFGHFMAQICAIASGMFIFLWVERNFTIQYAYVTFISALLGLIGMIFLYANCQINLSHPRYIEYASSQWCYRLYFLVYGLTFIAMHITVIVIPLRAYSLQLHLRYRVTLISLAIYGFLSVLYGINLIFGHNFMRLMDLQDYKYLQFGVSYLFALSSVTAVITGTKNSKAHYNEHF